MKYFRYILFFLLSLICSFNVHAQPKADFQWGNASYFNINIGETIYFQDTEVKLLQLNNHFNQIKIGCDTICLKVSRRTLPVISNGLRIFVADNKNVKALVSNSNVHSLLQKDALICMSNFKEAMLDQRQYVFPISFSDGFIWNAEEDSHMFSYQSCENKEYRSHGGIDIDMHDARGNEKHTVVALENSKVIWIVENANMQACVLLGSESQPDIFYIYNFLDPRKIEVKKGESLVRGEAIGNIWGGELWGHLHFAVVKSDTIPDYNSKYNNAVNFFPEFYELYFNQTYSYYKTFTRGIIEFGRRSDLHRNEKNLASFEEYLGKGWILEKWNTADRVELSTNGEVGNARLQKVLFAGEKATCRNPDNWYDYEICVQNGTYRIRSKMGDYNLASWQKIEFENVFAANYSLQLGEFKWTPEKVVKVKDGKLTVRIFVDETNQKPAGISEIVFQRAD